MHECVYKSPDDSCDTLILICRKFLREFYVSSEYPPQDNNPEDFGLLHSGRHKNQGMLR